MKIHSAHTYVQAHNLYRSIEPITRAKKAEHRGLRPLHIERRQPGTFYITSETTGHYNLWLYRTPVVRWSGPRRPQCEVDMSYDSRMTREFANNFLPRGVGVITRSHVQYLTIHERYITSEYREFLDAHGAVIKDNYLHIMLGGDDRLPDSTCAADERVILHMAGDGIDMVTTPDGRPLTHNTTRQVTDRKQINKMHRMPQYKAVMEVINSEIKVIVGLSDDPKPALREVWEDLHPAGLPAPQSDENKARWVAYTNALTALGGMRVLYTTSDKMKAIRRETEATLARDLLGEARFITKAVPLGGWGA